MAKKGGNLGFGLTVTNAAKMVAALSVMDANVRRKLSRLAVSAALTPMLKRVKNEALATKDTGTLSRSIIRKIKTIGSRGISIGIVGPDKRYSETVSRSVRVGGRLFHVRRRMVPANYAHLVEFGTKPHAQPKGFFSKHHKGSRANPFLRRSFDSTQSAATAAYTKNMAKGLKREWDRLGSKTK